MSNEEIAALFSRIDQALAGIAEHGKQPKLDQDMIEDILTESKDDRRAMMQYTLNMLWRVIYPLFEQEKNPHLKLEATDRLLKLMDLEARLWGLNKQPQAEYRPQPTLIREVQASKTVA